MSFNVKFLNIRLEIQVLVRKLVFCVMKSKTKQLIENSCILYVPATEELSECMKWTFSKLSIVEDLKNKSHAAAAAAASEDFVLDK